MTNEQMTNEQMTKGKKTLRLRTHNQQSAIANRKWISSCASVVAFYRGKNEKPSDLRC